MNINIWTFLFYVVCGEFDYYFIFTRRTR